MRTAAPMTRRAVGRAALAGFFVAAGASHFVAPAYFRGMVPAYLPDPAALVAVSGAAEIVGGAALLWPRTRPAAGVGLVALLAAVLPANVEMLRSSAANGDAWWVQGALWLRLPLQGLLAWWVWRASRPDDEATVA